MNSPNTPRPFTYVSPPEEEFVLYEDSMPSSSAAALPPVEAGASIFSPRISRPSASRPPVGASLFSPGLLPGSSSAAVPLEHSSAATATATATATGNSLSDWNYLYSDEPMPVPPRFSAPVPVSRRRQPQARTYSPKAMAVNLNRRKLVLSENKSPGEPFLDVRRYAVPPSFMDVALSPPGERDAPPPYPIKTYHTHPDSDILIGTRRKYTDEGDEYREIPEFPHAIFEVRRTLVPNKFYTIASPTNGAFPYTLDELRAVEQKRLASINRARGGKRRHSRHPKKHRKRKTHRRR